MTRPTVDVLVPVALERPYTYRVPAGLSLAPGDLVRVPLGAREVTGCVWGEGRAAPGLDNRLRDVAAKLDGPPLAPALMSFVDWVARYTLTTPGMVLRMVLRAPEGLPAERPRVGVRLAGPPPQRVTPARARVLELLADGLARGRGEAAQEAGVGLSVVDGLVDEGTLETLVLPPGPAAPPPDPDHAVPRLEAAQAEAARDLVDAVAAERFSVSLLDGVTGSGKTEVYFEAVAEAIRRGRQVLILMPEIALTAPFLDRFAGRFGVRPAEWHSDLTPRRRERTFAGVRAGEVAVVAGARSALFLPYARLGLIVVDEEHDAAYKQEDGVRYHARDMAVVRAQREGIPVVLASATPSIESRVNADRGRYRRLVLPDRFGGAALPRIEAIDMRREGPPSGRFVSDRLAREMAGTIGRGEQVLLYLNRRGYAPLTLCRSCGHRMKCPQCDAWLVDHRFRRRLVCHHCGFSTPPPATCPSCDAAGSFVACGPGIERLAEEAAALLPGARTLVLSSDLVAGIERLREELAAVARGEVDLVIGTQIVAKGHHFPKLALVGVVDGDLGLGQSDPRAAERTFQVLHQVVGRAGRETGHGRGLVQTHDPQHPVMAALVSGDREQFYAREIAGREQAALPPFGRLATVLAAAPTAHEAEGFVRALLRAAPPAPDVRILGPAEPPLALVRGRHRSRLVVKAPRAFDLSGYLRGWLAAGPQPKGRITLEVDVDPQSFL